MTSARLYSLSVGFRKRSQDIRIENPSASYWYGLASIDYRNAANYFDAGNLKEVVWFVHSARNSTRVARRRMKSGNRRCDGAARGCLDHALTRRNAPRAKAGGLTMDDDTGEFSVPVLVPRDELENLARLVMDLTATLSNSVLSVDAVRAVAALSTAARRVLPALPAVDSVDRE